MPSRADYRFALPRTALLLNLAGVQAQRATGHKTVSLAHLRTLAANVVWDWHFLPRLAPLYRFIRPPGDLRWVPRHGGAVVEIIPSSDEYQAVMELGTFIEFEGFVRSSDFHITEPTSTVRGKAIKFPQNLDTSTILRHQVGALEEKFWRMLIDAYSTLSARCLSVLASCRNENATALSAAAELTHWCDSIRMFLDSVVVLEQDFDGSVINTTALREAWDARALYVMRLADGEAAPECVERLRQASMTTDLGRNVPCQLPDDPTYARDLDLSFFEGAARKWLGAIDDLCRLLYTRYETPDNVKYGVVSKSIDALMDLPGLRSEMLKAEIWQALIANGGFRVVSNRCRELVRVFAEETQKNTKLNIIDSPSFYTSLFESAYPLPPIPSALAGLYLVQ